MRTQRVVFMVCTAVALSVGACTGDSSGPDAAHDATVAKATWHAQAAVRYAFTAYRVCECLADAVGPVRVTVESGSVVSVSRVDNGASVDKSLWFDVDDLFELIEAEIASRPKLLEARYDAARGYPTYIAYGQREVDAGATIEITSFALNPGV